MYVLSYSYVRGPLPHTAVKDHIIGVGLVCIYEHACYIHVRYSLQRELYYKKIQTVFIGTFPVIPGEYFTT